MQVLNDSNGGRMAMPSVEVKKLEDFISTMTSNGKGVATAVRKAIGLPAWNKLSVNMEHILSGHKVGGTRLTASAAAGKGKDVFPEWMTDKQILSAIKEAYQNSKRVGTQESPVGKVIELVGKTKSGMEVRMYVNVTKKTLDTAFPQFGR